METFGIKHHRRDVQGLTQRQCVLFVSSAGALASCTLLLDDDDDSNNDNDSIAVDELDSSCNAFQLMMS